MAVIIGTPGPDDNLRGTAEADIIFALGGADNVQGRQGDDIILAGPGNDTIFGDNGLPDLGPVPVRFGGTPGNNLIVAGPGDDMVTAGFGADTVFGGTGNDTINGYGAFGAEPTATAEVIGADGPDRLFGEQGDDLLRGGGGGDLLDGGNDNDTLIGGRGVDTLFGGAGHDVFAFGRNLEPFTFSFTPDTGIGPGNRDLVVDFHQGQDRLDLSGYNVQGAPVFLGMNPFGPGEALQVRFEIEADHTVVQFLSPFGGSIPPGPTGEIELVGVHHLTADDFILT
jgi:Ca2+-binding RTX toxin-like protein